MPTLEEVLRDLERRVSDLERRSSPQTVPSTPLPPKKAVPHNPTVVSAKTEAPEPASGSFFGLIGIGFVILAVVFFLKLTIDSGWLTPVRQVTLAAFFGLGCLLLPHNVKKLGDDYGALLSGTGATVLHLTWLAAFGLHHIIDSQTALVLATAVGVISILLNTKMANAVFVVVAIAGTYLAAPLVGYQGQSPTSLFGFFLIWNFSFSALAFALKRRDVLLIAAYFAVLTIAAYSFTQHPFTDDLARAVMILQLQQLGIFSIAMFAFSTMHRIALKADESWACCVLLLLFYADTFRLASQLIPDLAPWYGVSLSVAVLVVYKLAHSIMKMPLAGAPAITTFAALVLLHSLYFRLTPDEWKPAFSLALALLLAALSRGEVPTFWRAPLRVALAAIGYGALLTFSSQFSSDLTLAYHFAYGVLSVILAAAILGAKPGSVGTLLLGFGHIEMLCGLYQLSLRVAAISGSLFVSLTWGLYALAVLAWAFSGRDRVVGQSAVIILAAVSLKAAFYDVLNTGSLSRVLSLLAAGLLLYVCGWIFRQMELWKAKT